MSENPELVLSVVTDADKVEIERATIDQADGGHADLFAALTAFFKAHPETRKIEVALKRSNDA